MNLFLTVSFLLILSTFSSSSNCSCIKTVSETPKLGTVFSMMNGKRVKELRGVVLYPNGEVMSDAVVEVYENRLPVSDGNLSYEDVKRITSVATKAACITAKDGRFCFKYFRPGRYLLRIGHRYDSQFSAMHVINPSGRPSSKSELRVELQISI